MSAEHPAVAMRRGREDEGHGGVPKRARDDAGMPHPAHHPYGTGFVQAPAQGMRPGMPGPPMPGAGAPPAPAPTVQAPTMPQPQRPPAPAPGPPVAHVAAMAGPPGPAPTGPPAPAPGAPMEDASVRKGAWSKDEDEKLRVAAIRHGGRNWKAVAEEMGNGRTAIQCLQHWNKVLNPGLNKGPWTKEEDDVVIEMVTYQMTNGGRVRWSEIATRLQSRSSKQVRERWVNHLDPTINKGRWTEEEDKAITDAHATLGNKWVAIARIVPGRTENSVKNRWHCLQQRAERRSGNRSRSTASGSGAGAGAGAGSHVMAPAHTAGLMAGVIAPPSHLSAAAAVEAQRRRLGQPQPAGGPMRYQPHVHQRGMAPHPAGPPGPHHPMAAGAGAGAGMPMHNPDPIVPGVARKGAWSKPEDDLLRAAADRHGGRNWKLVAEELGNSRTAAQCLHHWTKVLKPGLSKGPWSSEEDDVVRKMVQKYDGTRVRWSEIASNLPGRLAKQVRERWVNHLDPTVRKGPWTDDEDRIICEAQKELGNKWVEIAKRVAGRSENSVKNRWHCLMQKQKRRNFGE